MSRATVILNSKYERNRVAAWAESAATGTIVEFKQSKRSLDQNARLWACLTEIARKVEWHGLKLTADDWKDIFTAGLRKHRFVPGLDANTVVPLGMRTSDMTKQEFSDLLELINAFAAERGIEFNEPSDAPPASDEGSDDAPPPGSVVAADPSEPVGGPVEAGETEVAADQSTSSAGDLITLKRECIAKFLAAATDQTVPSAKDRQETVISAKDSWKQTLSTDLAFVKACTDTANKVVKGELSAPVARHYLEGLL